MQGAQALQIEEGAAARKEVKQERGPWMGTIWLLVVFIVLCVQGYNVARDTTCRKYGCESSQGAFNVLYIPLGWRSLIAFLGYLVMQIGLWYTENNWDEEGSAAWLAAAGADKGSTPEEYEAKFAEGADVTIPEDELKAAFPTPWGFLVGWWLWGLSYLFPTDGSLNLKPTVWGILAALVCVFISIVASVPMADAVQNRLGSKKMMLSLMFLAGWITLGVMTNLDIRAQWGEEKFYSSNSSTNILFTILSLAGPVTIVMSQKILFGARKMGTAWESSGMPNFRPIVYNMGGPLFVWGWFMLFVATTAMPYSATASTYDLYEYAEQMNLGEWGFIPIFLTARTALAFFGGCGMVPIVRFLDFTHDEDGKWMGENSEGKVFSRWWYGTDGSKYGLFLESPWPFVIMWTCFGFSSFLTLDNGFAVGLREVLLFVNCVALGVDAGILVQQNLYAGNMQGKNCFSVPFLLLFVTLAVNIGSLAHWRAAALSVPGMILIVRGQMTVFKARKRGDYTMQHEGKPNPYDQVFVYTWGEVIFMMGWILISLAMSLPKLPWGGPDL